MQTESERKPIDVPDEIKQIDNMLLPVKVVDSCLNRLYYMTPDSGFEFVDALAVATGNMQELAGKALRSRQKYNLLKSVIDAYCAMVVQVPSIDVTTTGGSWAQRRSAEALGLFIDGVLTSSGAKEFTWNCVIDSCLNRLGAVRVDEDGEGGITVKRILPHQLKWNPAEGRDPRHIYTETPIARAVLEKKYEGEPEKLLAIKEASNHRPDPLFDGIDGTFAWNKTDMVTLYEKWRKADADGTDGRYVACIRSGRGDCVLEDEEYKLPVHKIIPLRFSPSYATYAGCPAGDTLLFYQSELDDFSSTIKETFVKGGVMRVFLEKGCEVDIKELDIEVGRIVWHNPGKPPVMDRGTAPTPEYLQREQINIERAHEFMGISYNAARGVKADGISSAKGQREVAALAQNRLVLNMQTIQDWIVAIGKVIILIADLKYDGKKEITVRVPGNRLLNRIKWSEIGYKQEDFEINCDAINALSRHPAARIEEILELRQGMPNAFSERDALKAIGNKDLQSVRDEAFAVEDFAEMIIDLALDGDYRAPDPYMGTDGLQMLIEKGRKRYVQEMVQKKPSEYLNLLRQLIEAAKTELSNAKSATLANAPAPPPGPNMGAGAPPPGPGAPPPMAVGGAGLPSDLGAAAAPPPVAGQGLA